MKALGSKGFLQTREKQKIKALTIEGILRVKKKLSILSNFDCYYIIHFNLVKTLCGSFAGFFVVFFLTVLKFIYLFIYFWLCWVLASVRGPSPVAVSGGHPPSRSRASHRRGPPRCGAQAPDAQAQQPWLTGPAAPRHVGSSQTRARTRVPCTGRQTPNHCATREAPFAGFYYPYHSLEG